MSERGLRDCSVLLTGATGFLGRAVAERFAAEGAQLTCLLRPGRDRGALDGLKVTEVIEGSLDGADALPAVAERAKRFDVIAHVAGATKKSKLARSGLFAVNEGGTGRLLEACAKSAARVVYVSTMAAYGPCASPSGALEDGAPAPISNYGASKLAGELRVRSEAPRRSVTILRPAGIYGPRDRSLLALFRLVEGRRLRPVAGRVVNFMHVDDAARAVTLAAAREPRGVRVYHLGGENLTVAALGREVARALGRRAAPLPSPGALFVALAAMYRLSGGRLGLAADHAREFAASWCVSSERARAELSWEARTSIADGFAALVESYRAAGAL